jgi:replication-associated recombination protein RarA
MDIKDIKFAEKAIKNSWTEKYRPSSIKELVCDEYTEKYFKNMLNNKTINNMTLYGSAGGGKTSLVNIITKTLEPITLYVDGSSETGIENVKNNIQQFASTGRIDKTKLKLVVINEFNLSSSAQQALKDIIEKSDSYVCWIFLTNNISTIIDPLLSRCPAICIRPPIKDIVMYIAKILDKENVTYEKLAIVTIVKKLYPDIRKIINTCYNLYQAFGTIKEEYISNNINTYYEIFDKIFSVKNIKDIVDILKKSIYDDDIYSSLANYCIEKYESAEAVIMIADKMAQSKIIFDKDLNLLSTILIIKDVIGK